MQSPYIQPVPIPRYCGLTFTSYAQKYKELKRLKEERKREYNEYLLQRKVRVCILKADLAEFKCPIQLHSFVLILFLRIPYFFAFCSRLPHCFGLSPGY